MLVLIGGLVLIAWFVEFWLSHAVDITPNAPTEKVVTCTVGALPKELLSMAMVAKHGEPPDGKQ